MLFLDADTARLVTATLWLVLVTGVLAAGTVLLAVGSLLGWSCSGESSRP